MTRNMRWLIGASLTLLFLIGAIVATAAVIDFCTEGKLDHEQSAPGGAEQGGGLGEPPH